MRCETSVRPSVSKKKHSAGVISCKDPSESLRPLKYANAISKHGAYTELQRVISLP